jgi:hypothetical protein
VNSILPNCLLIGGFVCAAAFTPAGAAEPVESAAAGKPVANSAMETTVPGLPPEEAKAAIQWAVYLVQANLPPTYEGKKNWGETKRVYAGVDIDNDGLKLKTHRKYKEVRHGKWLKYNIDMKDPNDPKYLKIEVVSAGLGHDGRLNISLRIDTKVDIEARQERWNYGLQLYSISTEATARLRMSMNASIGFAFDYTRIPPDVILDPLVETADIQLIDLEVDKISKLGSDIAEEIGDIAKRVIREEYLPRQREKLSQKLNAQINRRRDRLRISASDWISEQLTTTR